MYVKVDLRAEDLFVSLSVSPHLSFNTFVLKVYLKAWNTCACPASAPRDDLTLLKTLEAYKNQDPAVAKAAITSFSGHFWYLSKMLIGLAFF